MRIGIYNRWLHTMGGGERETGAFAQVLQADHRVELISHRSVDLDLFANRLNLRIPDVGLRTLPYDPDYRRVIAASAGYDLFLNISHGDMFVPRARHNILRVFFPGRSTAAAEAPFTLISGFFRPEAGADRPFAWTGHRARMLLANQWQTRRAPRPKALQITAHAWRPPRGIPATVRLLVNDLPLATRTFPPDGIWVNWRVRLPSELADAERLSITLETTTFNPRDLDLSDDERDLGIALAAVRLVPGVWPAPFARRPQALVPDEVAYADMRARQTHHAAAAYEQLLANSCFTQRWIGRRWGLSSEVVYPPVDVESLSAGSKQPFILSVGRFFAGSHNKKHLPMIQAFRALCDAGLHGWEYHLVGGYDEAMPEHRAYLQQVRAAADGYPIRLHVNVPFAELRALYRAAQIFWHATGFGEDEDQAPEHFEHFGIATVEAMAAECVPVVIGKAGQPEIVEPGVSGLLWNTLPELQAQTRALVDDPKLRAQLARGARQRSQAFGMDRFAHAVHALVAGLPG